MGLGIGAAWNEWESRGLGIDFPPIAERFGRLEEAIQICLQMWSDSEEPFEGAYHHLERTLNSPQSLSRPHPFLMIGGGGEKKTLRLVAQYADACNISTAADVATKLEVLRRHCDDVGRDYDTIEKTAMARVTAESTVDDVVRETERLKDAGFTAVYWFAVGMPEPTEVVELLGGALARA
jgi:alkanesulfonate monooxygenase SsuD/methylene tetrahydromethanopterin reductase-like flavin-dependent oxidoreductase (luciferase family)